MSKRYTMHGGTGGPKAVCGVKVGPKRLTHIHDKIECRRCRSILGIARSWAQEQQKRREGQAIMRRIRGERKPPKQATRPLRHSDLVALDEKAIAELKTAVAGSGDYTPEQLQKHAPRPKTRALNRGLDALLGVGDMPRTVEVSAERLAALELVYKHAVELCDAVDAAEEDIGGHRSTSEILGDLGPATSKVDALTQRVRNENAG